MALAAARVDDLEQGDLPAICAKTGEPCVGLVKDTLWVVPRWVPALLALLIFPYYVGGRLDVTPHRGRRCRSRRAALAWIRRFVRAAWVALVLAAAGLAAALLRRRG